MKNDLNDLKKLTLELLKNGNSTKVQEDNQTLIHRIYGKTPETPVPTHYPENTTPYTLIPLKTNENTTIHPVEDTYTYEEATEEERFSLQQQEKEMIKKALEHNEGKRRETAKELGISERTLYRKIKQYNLDN